MGFRSTAQPARLCFRDDVHMFDQKSLAMIDHAKVELAYDVAEKTESIRQLQNYQVDHVRGT